jgi:hypothetical protein
MNQLASRVDSLCMRYRIGKRRNVLEHAQRVMCRPLVHFDKQIDFGTRIGDRLRTFRLDMKDCLFRTMLELDLLAIISTRNVQRGIYIPDYWREKRREQWARNPWP